MILTAFDIPESQSDIPTWIESVMCAGDLRSLVAQLQAVSDCTASQTRSQEQRDASSVALDNLLADHRESVLTDGLREVPREVITSLLQSPGLLLRLQELTMIAGGDYWQQRYADSQGFRSEIAESRSRLYSLIDAPTKSSVHDHARAIQPSEQTHSDTLPPSAASSGDLARWLAIAAAVVLAVGVWVAMKPDAGNQPQIAQQPAPVNDSLVNDSLVNDSLGSDGQSVQGIGWGWASEKGVPVDLSGSDYLQALSVGAASWGKKQPADKDALLKRLREFRAGCNRLANMDHPNLQANDQQWLKDSCENWLAKIDTLIDQSGEIEFDALKQQADAIAASMESTLSERSKIA